MGERNQKEGNYATISSDEANGTFTDQIYVAKGKTAFIHVEGSGVLTTTAQYRLPGETTWNSESDDGGVSGLYEIEGAGKWWRSGCLNGDYTSGTKTVNITGSSTDRSK